MDKELVAIRNEVVRVLEEKYFLVPKGRAQFILGGIAVLLLFTVGGSWVAVRTSAQRALESVAATSALAKLNELTIKGEIATQKITDAAAALSVPAVTARIDAVDSRVETLEYKLGGAILAVVRSLSDTSVQTKSYYASLHKVLVSRFDNTALVVENTYQSMVATQLIDEEDRRRRNP